MRVIEYPQIVWGGGPLTLIRCTHYFRKSAACVKGLHGGINFHCLKRILHLPQGADSFKEKQQFPHFSRNIILF